MKMNVLNLKKEIVGEIELSADIFAIAPRKDILHRVMEWQRAKSRAGTHKTKGISDISGTTKKPYKQKGTGNARQGSLRSPQFRGGAVIFGPVVRSHAYDLPKKVRKLGLKMALSDKVASGKVMILDDININQPKTTLAKEIFGKFGITSALIIDGEAVDNNFAKAINNINNIDALPCIGANVYDIIKHENLILTKSGVAKLEERLK